MTIKLLDGSKCKDFHGGWYPHMEKAVGKTVSDIKVTNPYDFKTNHFIEYEQYYYVWLNDMHYFWDKRFIEIVEETEQ